MQVLLFFALYTMAVSHFQEYYPNIRRLRRAQLQFDSSNIIMTDVLIIGVGLSGLETARLLQQNNIRTTVLEGCNRIGGRIWSIKAKNNHNFYLGVL
ncbi:unnamed protein product [Rotaria socialis]|uniref:Amine oxidase domain-containing protein n=1 Tax=Rotaria socialis TaxID=392032 RepID=A0A820FTH7_9BILA|nr:unnamed protein product [Rotaria socialis]CAF4332137.1 unnamed protein product [Rotaria socialis]CAF4418641.1 unnamed protein product [Rotaria socialis]CAF4635498.1 unnamed protein product [Rotaria socialis]